VKKLHRVGRFAVIVYLLVWAVGVPLYVLYGKMPAAEVGQKIPDTLVAPALLTAAGREARPVRLAWLSSRSDPTTFPMEPVLRGCIAESCRNQEEALQQPAEYYDLVMIEGFRYFSEGSRYFGEEAERMLVRELFKRTKRSGIMVLPRRMLHDLPPAAGALLVLPGDDRAEFIAVSPGQKTLPDTDPEELERRLCLMAGEDYWPQGTYPAVYPDPGRRLDVRFEAPRPPLLGVWKFRPVLIVASSSAVLWALLRLVLARRESVARLLGRGENAAAFAFVLVLAARMSCHLEFRIGCTPWDILPLIPIFWIGGGIFFRGKSAVAWASILASSSLFVFFREEWMAAGKGWGLFGVLLFWVLVAASERRLLREQHALPFRRAFLAELGGFAVAGGLWLLVREQPLECQAAAFAIPAAVCRLAACRNLF